MGPLERRWTDASNAYFESVARHRFMALIGGAELTPVNSSKCIARTGVAKGLIIINYKLLDPTRFLAHTCYGVYRMASRCP
jgi:hypothetical protein